MIRNRSTKYIHRYPDGPNEFYDLVADPGETSNEIGNPAFRGAIEGMRTELQDWFDRYTEPAHDGTKQAVKGRGQTDLIGAISDSEAFAQDLTYRRDLANTKRIQD